MDFEDLIGKTIVEAERKRLAGYDDSGYLYLKFSDGSEITVVASYDTYRSYESVGEYPTEIYLENMQLSDFEPSDL